MTAKRPKYDSADLWVRRKWLWGYCPPCDKWSRHKRNVQTRHKRAFCSACGQTVILEGRRGCPAIPKRNASNEAIAAGLAATQARQFTCRTCGCYPGYDNVNRKSRILCINCKMTVISQPEGWAAIKALGKAVYALSSARNYGDGKPPKLLLALRLADARCKHLITRARAYTSRSDTSSQTTQT